MEQLDRLKRVLLIPVRVVRCGSKGGFEKKVGDCVKPELGIVEERVGLRSLQSTKLSDPCAFQREASSYSPGLIRRVDARDRKASERETALINIPRSPSSKELQIKGNNCQDEHW